MNLMVRPSLSASLAEALQSGLCDLGLDLSSAQQEKLLAYVALLDKWNKVYNLTAVRDPAKMIGRHILDSLALLPHLGIKHDESKSILDVGCGGGLPGICLAIAAPTHKVVMLDSLQKKTTFVRQAIGELGLHNAAVVCARVEAYQATTPFDIVTSRAFAELGDFVTGARHLVASHGKMIAMKGVYPHDEIARLAQLPDAPRVAEVIVLEVPQIEGKRHLVVMEVV